MKMRMDRQSIAACRRRMRLACLFAWQAALASRKRVMLAIIGVAVGIASVVSMLMIGASVKAQSMQMLASLGGDVVTIEQEDAAGRGVRLMPHPLGHASAPAALPPARALQAMRALVGTMPEVGNTTHVIAGANCFDGPEGANQNVGVMGVRPDLVPTAGLKLANGRFITPAEGTALHLVLGSRAAAEMRKTRPELRVGSGIALCGQRATVVGILEFSPGAELLEGLQLNQSALVNVDALRALGASGERVTVLARPRPGIGTEVLVERLRSRFATLPDMPVKVSAASVASKLRSEQASLYSTFLAVLGGVALAVGALGITNIMIVAVTERRAEIGLRKAVGARVTDIAAQFVFEATIICALGGLAGALVGIAGTGVVLLLAGLPPSVDWTTPLVVISLSCLSGLAAGAYPAMHAAQLDPVQTLMG